MVHTDLSFMDENSEWIITRIGRSEERRRYKERHPEVVRRHRIKYLEKKIETGVFVEKKLRSAINTLTRLKFRDILPMVCVNCGCRDYSELHIHHIRYAYPILEKDLKVLCRKCHVLEHQKIDFSGERG